MHVSRYRRAVFLALLALVSTMLTMGPSLAASDCPDGQTQFKIDERPANGTYGDGTLSVTISGADEDSFSWSSNIAVESVMVKAGSTLKSNPGGTSGSASSAQNPNNDKRYGISHVSFCYVVEDEGGDEEDDCVGRDSGKECEENDCPEDGSGKGAMGKDCDGELEDCPDGSAAMGHGCEESDEDDDETLADVDEQPAEPRDRNPGRVDAGRRPAPRTDVKGLRFADRGDEAVSADTAAQIQGQQEPGGTLPFTGAALAPFLMVGLGFVGVGTLLWRRRHER